MLKEDKCVNNKNCLENKHIIPYLSIILRSEYVYISRHLNTKYNFGRTQLYVLRKLSLTNKPLNQEFFSKHCQINKGSIARTCQKLEENDYIKRVVDPNNKRQYIIYLTKKGEEVATEIKILEKKWENKICEEYDGTKEELLNYLRKMTLTSFDMINDNRDNIYE